MLLWTMVAAKDERLQSFKRAVDPEGGAGEEYRGAQEGERLAAERCEEGWA